MCERGVRCRSSARPTYNRGPGAIAQLGERLLCNAGGRRFESGWLHRRSPPALRLFDGFVEIAGGQLDRLASEGVLRPDLDREWAVLHVVVFNLATVLFREAIERRLPAPFLSPGQLQRWNEATTALLREGAIAIPSRE